MKRLFYFTLFLFSFTILSYSQVNYNKIYYFYYSLQDEKPKPVNILWIYNDTCNEYHEFTNYGCKENKYLLSNSVYLGYGFVDKVIINEEAVYFQCSRFRKYCDFTKSKEKLTPWYIWKIKLSGLNCRKKFVGNYSFHLFLIEIT